MKTYTLKLRTNNGHTYATYDGETQLSDSDLTTLFGSAGEAYFVFDYGTYTPDTTTGFHVVNSQGNIVMVDTTTSIAEGKNFKGEWDGSGSRFNSFAQLSAYGLDESQLSTLVEKMGEGKIRTIDVSSSGDYVFPWSYRDGIYRIVNSSSGNINIKVATVSGDNPSSTTWVLNARPNATVYVVVAQRDSGYNSEDCIFMFCSENAQNSYVGNNILIGRRSISPRYMVNSSLIADNLTSGAGTGYVLNANQGRILNNNIGNLTTLTTTAKTSTVAAINELVTSITGITPLTGNLAPTTSTVGEVGQIYLDTTNDKVYILKSIVEESGQPDVYNWEELGGGGGSYDVFTTNEWNALWS